MAVMEPPCWFDGWPRYGLAPKVIGASLESIEYSPYDSFRMAYRIPSVKVLEDSIRRVIREQQSIPSQRRFTELVLEDLRKKNPEYKVSEVRLRRMALHRNLARVTISYRESKEASKKGRCPVCCSPTEELHNLTLDDKKVELGFKCTKCPYWTGPRRRVPVRYTFSMVGSIVQSNKKKGKYAQWKFA